MKRGVLILIAMMLQLALAAQYDAACPGFRNPLSFNTGSAQYTWTARVGERVYPTNDTDTTTGYYVMSTCASTNAQTITGHNNITSNTLNSGADGGINCCNDGNLWDAMDKRFAIITPADAGLDQFTINGANGMPRIPPGYTSSIRLGDPRATGDASYSHNWAAGSNKGSEALFYTMRVTSQNALLFVNYAVVGRCFPHTAREAGEFLIRVVRQNADGTWPNQPINDSLWFKVSAPDLPQNGQPAAPWVMGRPGSSCSSTTCGYVYKPWTKVAINLNNYLYETVRIEMYTSDCIYDVDPIYAYISGDYSPMILRTTGCPDHTSSVIDTIKAPAQMISYQWFVCTGEAVAQENFFNRTYMENVSFRQVYPTATGQTTTDSIFTPTLHDFVITEGANMGDTVAEKTFMCIMTSAMDPQKPFQSRLYANVSNARPLVRHSDTTLCDGTVRFENRSITFGTSHVDESLTSWDIYSDAECNNLIGSVSGDTASYHFDEPGIYTVRLNCHSYAVGATGDTSRCSASETFNVHAVAPTGIAMGLNRHILCDDERLYGRALNVDDPTTPLSLNHTIHWQVGDTTFDNVDTVLLSLPYGDLPVVLTATNVWGCTSTATDTVHVYGTPTISMGTTTNTICIGDTVVLSAEANARYVWSSTPNDTALAAQQGQSTIAVSPAQTTVYTLEPVPENPCSAVGVNVTIEVLPTPVPQIWFNATSVGIDNPTVTMTDISNDRASTQWHFSDGLSDEGISVSHTFLDLNADSVTINMTTCNRLDCCADTAVKLPVQNESIWFPNTFTPGSADENSHFRIVSTQPLLQFELYIYNRTGMLVYTTTDPLFEWDGKDLHGQPCPQGAYVYYYRYTLLGIDDYHPGAGTVTLIR